MKKNKKTNNKPSPIDTLINIGNYYQARKQAKEIDNKEILAKTFYITRPDSQALLAAAGALVFIIAVSMIATN